MEVIYHVDEAQKMLESGRIIAVMTDTVMGLIADGENEQTIEQLYKIKKRPVDKSCIVFLDSDDKLTTITTNIPPYVDKLTAEFWPGVLTLILPTDGSRTYHFLADNDMIGVRVPDVPDLLSLVQCSSTLIISTSANISGKQELTSQLEVEKTFGDAVVFWQIEDTNKQTKASTIINACQNESWTLIREGTITKEMIWQALDKK